MREPLQLPWDLYEQLIAHARAAFPLEACGILAGRDHEVMRFYPMTNVDQSHEHFMMDPPEQFAIARALRKDNQEMLAIYHSHPESPPRPSPEDIRLALTPAVVYVIVSLMNPAQPHLKGFDINDGNVKEVPVTITRTKI